MMGASFKQMDALARHCINWPAKWAILQQLDVKVKVPRVLMGFVVDKKCRQQSWRRRSIQYWMSSHLRSAH